MKNIFWFLIIVAAGTLLYYIAYIEYKRETALAETHSEIQAEVIENRKNGKFYHPVLSYTYKGIDYKEQASNSGSNPPTYSVGEHVTVYVNPSDSSDIEIKSFFNQIGKPLILLLFGTFCFMASIQILKGRFKS